MSLKSDKIYDAYVDGSFSAKSDIGAWAYTIVDSNIDQSIAEASGFLNYNINPDLRKLRNIATECQAVLEALDYASIYGFKLNIYYDYVGLEKWVCDITTKEIPWQCKNDFTWEYRQSVLTSEQYINSMIKVKGHSGNKWNEYTDGLATNLTGTNKRKTTIK